MPRQRQTSEERIASKAKNQAKNTLYKQKRRSNPELRAKEQAQSNLKRRISREKVNQTQTETEVLWIIES
jgi:hypothetical protein